MEIKSNHWEQGGESCLLHKERKFNTSGLGLKTTKIALKDMNKITDYKFKKLKKEINYWIKDWVAEDMPYGSIGLTKKILKIIEEHKESFIEDLNKPDLEDEF